MTLIDISRRLGENVPTWPGDTPFSFELSWTKADSGSVNVGKVTMSTHTGTHIDAPFHFSGDGQKVIDLDIARYVGEALVIHALNMESIGAEDLKHIHLEGVTRLLIRTDSWKDQRVFPPEFTFLRPDIAPYLAEKGVQLIGVDVPSVDAIDSKTLPAHHALHNHHIHILESVQLAHVDPGKYELIALPLPLVEGDGSPVRAVLRKNETNS
ncbi:arylformamidase [Longirhabdus pacifica]|uniref:arylformamidase n=1 Tax=Longirhabdus pacifica TaxID=2305227 RepID=UPI00100896FC|nr:arylformamidase [Longirhabdus pacifica]